MGVCWCWVGRARLTLFNLALRHYHWVHVLIIVINKPNSRAVYCLIICSVQPLWPMVMPTYHPIPCLWSPTFLLVCWIKVSMNCLRWMVYLGRACPSGDWMNVLAVFHHVLSEGYCSYLRVITIIHRRYMVLHPRHLPLTHQTCLCRGRGAW